MMTTEARAAAVKERVRAKQQQKRLRWIAAGLAAAAFLVGAVLGAKALRRGRAINQ